MEVNQGQMGNALALSEYEGRGKLRKAMGRSKHLLIHRCPNGETYYIEDVILWSTQM